MSLDVLKIETITLTSLLSYLVYRKQPKIHQLRSSASMLEAAKRQEVSQRFMCVKNRFVRKIRAALGIGRDNEVTKHLIPPYKDTAIQYPKATKCAERGMSLPTHDFLTEEEVAYICERLYFAIETVGLGV